MGEFGVRGVEMCGGTFSTLRYVLYETMKGCSLELSSRETIVNHNEDDSILTIF